MEVWRIHFSLLQINEVSYMQIYWANILTTVQNRLVLQDEKQTLWLNICEMAAEISYSYQQFKQK